MEHAIEIDNIKKDLRVTQDSVLLIHQDLKQMSKGITEMASSMKIMADIQINQKVMEERCDSRWTECKNNLKIAHSRIDDRDNDIEDVRKNTYYLLAIIISAMIGYVIYMNAQVNLSISSDATFDKQVSQNRLLIDEHTQDIDRIKKELYKK